MANDIVESIKSATSQMVEHPSLEPNMLEFMGKLILVSTLDGKERKEGLKLYSEMFSMQFGNPNCADYSNSAMWKLFKEVYSQVKKNGYKIGKSSAEAVLFRKLMEMWSYCMKRKKAGSLLTNINEFNTLSSCTKIYINSEYESDIFKKFVKEMFEEIQSCYKDV